ncbi:rr1 [Lambdina fiscellaria nucleopolyhedrovirus]|uniref:Ribonucleoside-diphosphate reductase n=1 Tax=Lambdina fiscellaria nucleopolyhedrovirus TaxID=1642929 RepID=A0A0E3UR91_9ABAC|nr:rr1 [Lambdina fiscellaria nucleopolyhedrovirus]AKC91630.1 rr1 [Lambdina fiscellaria nucleopolyhedrovirus]
MNVLYVIKRDGTRQNVLLDKITARISHLCENLNQDYIDPVAITLRVVKTIRAGITTEQLNAHAALETANMGHVHDDFSLLAGRILVNNMHKKINGCFSVCTKELQKHGLVSQRHAEIVAANADLLDRSVRHERDYDYRYFAVKTLKNGYLLKINGECAERIQHMLLRVAVGIHGEDIDAALETYQMMSLKQFTHASPTMFAAGTNAPQLSSCFLLTMREDSIDGIYNTLRDCANISKYGGGIGLNVNDVRANGSRIVSTNGKASGLEPMLRVFNNAVRHVDQGGKRKGAAAIYLEPWHADIYAVLNLRRNMGCEDSKARDLFFGLWVPDLFMRRVHFDAQWSLMCPDRCPLLKNVYGSKFEQLYKQYEHDGAYVRQVKARDLHRAIIECQNETGMPYMLYKDACNAKSNQSNVGTICCSNLCAEIVQYSAPDEVAVCNLASVCLNAFVDRRSNTYDFEQLKNAVQVTVRNLDRIIDVNFYPLEEARVSNMRHRPVGVGVQGLADAFAMLRLPYESQEARMLNIKIAETVYYGALEASCQLARELGTYESYAGSPASRGILQYDMWNVTPTSLWNWSDLKRKIAQFGLRNSLLVAYMPTATTAQIMGNNESFEPFTNNVYVRRVLAGDFLMLNRHLMRDLIEAGVYDDKMRDAIVEANGSVQNIDAVPQHIKELYKTVWEMKQSTLIGMAADRGAFIDQSQSFNVFVAAPTYALMSSIHYLTWKMGLKTGMYYLRTKPAAEPIKFTVLNKSKKCDENEQQIVAAVTVCKIKDSNCANCES